MGDNLIILIHGKAFAGKDSVYNTLRLLTSKHFQSIAYNEYQSFVNNVYTESIPDFLKQHVEHCIRVPFADEVKKELCRINPKVDYNRLMSDPVYKSNYRKELVEIGDGYRQDNSNIWVEKHRESFFPMLKKVSKKIIFITDARYLNEYKYGEEIEKETNNVVIRVKVEASLPDRLSRMPSNAITKYIKYSKYNDGENLDIIAESKRVKLNWDVTVDNSNVIKALPFSNAECKFLLPEAYNGKYINIFNKLRPQLDSIALLYSNMGSM